MKKPPAPLRKLLLSLVVAAGLFLAGCDYDVPLAPQADRAIDDRLLGRWLSPDAWMKVGRFDVNNYVVVHNGALYRAWHTTVAGLPLITLQSIETRQPKFAYLTCAVSADGQRLDVRVVRDDVVSKKIKDSAAMRKAIEEHVGNERMFTQPIPYSRME